MPRKDNFLIDIQLIYIVVLIAAVSKVILFYLYVHFLIFFFIVVHHRILTIVLCAVRKTLLFLHSIYKSLHLLTAASDSISPNPFPLDNHQAVLYVRDSIFISQIVSFVSYFRSGKRILQPHEAIQIRLQKMKHRKVKQFTITG